MHHGRRGGLFHGLFGKMNFGCRAAGIAYHDRSISFGRGAEGPPVRFFPAGGYLDIAASEFFPEIQVAVLSEMSHRSE